MEQEPEGTAGDHDSSSDEDCTAAVTTLVKEKPTKTSCPPPISFSEQKSFVGIYSDCLFLLHFQKNPKLSALEELFADENMAVVI